jgi:hemolysin activation/secretion protein
MPRNKPDSALPTLAGRPWRPGLAATRIDRPGTLARVPAALALCLLAAGAAAQSRPDAGRLLQETRPTPAPQAPAPPPRLLETPVRPTVAMPEGLTVTPSAFRITGARSFPAEELAVLVQPWVGKALDLRGLNEAAGAITRRYQTAGHFLSYAYLPAQKVADGVIEIAVLEGRIDSVQVANAQDVRLRDEVVQNHTEGLADRTPTLQADVERKLLLLNDIPGVTARAAFTPGATAGTADMVVSVSEDEPLSVSFDASNHGEESSGRFRLGGTVVLRNLFGWGDLTTARAIVSERGLLVSGALATLVPVGGDGLKLGASLSRLEYQLGNEFASLGAQGMAQTLGLRANYPVLRTLETNLYFDATAEAKKLRDEIVLIATTQPKRDDQATAALSFDRRDDWLGGGSWVGNLTLAAGRLNIIDAAQWELDYFGPPGGNGVGLRTDGSYRKLLYTLARQQGLFGPLSGYLRYSGQQTSRNLDSSEKLGLGGPFAVRAYTSGEALVDEGGLFSAELRWQHDYIGGSLLWSLFYDRGSGRINLDPLAGVTDNDVTLAGYGLGLQWSGGGFGLTGSLAWRTTRVPLATGGDRKPRIFVQFFYTP